MNHWLIKFAPFRYSWDDCLLNGKFEIYSVRNHQARNNLREMKLNDKVLFYQSQRDQKIMGLMKVIQKAHQDPTTTDPQWVSVTFEPVTTFRFPVMLADIKADVELREIRLITQPKLAVMELRKDEFDRVLELAKGF